MKPETTTIAILGCGWLGLPLGGHLARRGYRVRGSTTTPEKLPALEAAGSEPFLLRLEPELRCARTADFFDADVLFLNVPPGRRSPDVAVRYPRQMAAVQQAVRAAGTGFVVFASSTSVYPDLNRTVTEEDAGAPESDSGRALLEVEQALMQDGAFDATVLRFAGLYGYERKIGRFLAGRQDVPGGDAPVNLIHRDDAVGIVTAVLEQDVRGEILNACADAHPTRRNVYTAAATKLGMAPPTFAAGGPPSFKVVSNRRLRDRLGYRFRYPNPLDQAP